MSRLFPSLVLFVWYFLAAVFATEVVHESDTLKASNLHNSDRFSTFLALDGNTALIASPCNSVGGKKCCENSSILGKIFFTATSQVQSMNSTSTMAIGHNPL